MDKYFRVELLRATPNPQQLCWLAMHQDYSPHAVVDGLDKCPDETKAGQYLIDHCLKFGHWGVLEHAQISLNCIGFPHHTVMQLRTHRVGISFDVQSFRYTSQSILDVARGGKDIEEVFFIRPTGKYTDRKGAKYYNNEEIRNHIKESLMANCIGYDALIYAGFSEEHAREILPQSIRQHFVMSCNARTLLHLLEVRGTADVQLEAQAFIQLLQQRFSDWMPEIAEWHLQNRFGKNKLAP